jgi:DNA-binding response OmpR family regulator
MKILYVENHATFAQQVLQQFLREHSVTVVPSLSEARTRLTTGGCDLVLCDFDLDDEKGDVFVRELRAAHSELFVIAVSSHERGNAALLTAGASAVCNKMEFQRIGQVIADLSRDRTKR